MARDGAGNHSIPNTFVASTIASATDVNTNFTDISTALTASIAKDGQTTPSANLPMGTYRHTGVGAAAARTDYARAGEAQDGTYIFPTVGGTGDVITLTTTFAPSAYAAGNTVRIKAGAANTTAVTVNWNSLGAKSLKKANGDALTSAYIAAGDIFDITYDGTDFKIHKILISGPINENQATDIASASTIDLDAATGNYVFITGTTTITAVTLAQGYRRQIKFSGILTLTAGASLILPGNGANIITQAGDTAILMGEAAGVVRCISYARASGAATNEVQGADVASAATVNLTTATGNSLHITGTTTITAITLAQGAKRDVTFDGILTLTQGASLLLPPGASITTAAGDTASFVGEASSVVRCTSYTRAAAPALGSSPQLGAPSNLKITSNAGLATIAVTCDEVTLATSGNAYATRRAVSLTINSGTSGANGLDTGTTPAVAANTWYSVWVIFNGTTTAGLISTSATAPTLPSGYTFKARVGWIRTSGTAAANIGSIQYGRRAQYIVDGTTLTALRQMANGSTGSNWNAVAWSTYAPSTAASLRVAVANGTNNNTQSGAAPNANYGNPCSNTNPAPIGQMMGGSGGSQGNVVQGDIIPESATNIYYWSNSGNCVLVIIGWEDNL